MWLNPPWNLWPQVVEKLVQEKCAAIAICPAWTKPWVKQLVGMGSRRLYFEKGTRLFMLGGKPVPNTLWGTWAIRIDKGTRKEFDARVPYQKVFFHPAGA